MAPLPTHNCKHLALLTIQEITGTRHELQLEAQCTGEALYSCVSKCVRIPVDRLQVVRNGCLVEQAAASVELHDADTLLAAPRRKPPSARIMQAAAAAAAAASGSSSAAAADEDDDDDPVHFTLPENAYSWERALARLLTQHAHAPDLLLAWLFWIGPRNILAAVLVLAAMPLASRYQLGPVFILSVLIAAIFANLGTRKEGEASAYTVFNNFQPLPGQLDAEQLDQQVRQGRM